MMNKELFKILVCPMDRTPLTLADEMLVEKLNQAILAGRVCNHAGRPVSQPIEGGLIRTDGQFLYPILDGIPILLADEAVELSCVG